MNIPDEAYHAALNAFAEADSNEDALMKALTAALPFLQGVKVKALDEILRALITEQSEGEWDEATIEKDVRRFSARIRAAIEVAPSPRAQALEEAAKLCENNVEELGCWTRKLAPFDHGTQGIHSGMTYAAAIRALSSQPVADGWLPIETAPKDGTEFLGHDASTKTTHVTFVNSNGYFHDPDSHYYSEAPEFKPTRWRPLPSPPASEGAE